MTESMRDTNLSQKLAQEAAKILSKDPERAEKLLREALSADLYNGPAHNNLGVVYLERGALYEASSEFEWARKLLPGHPDPRMNLALTLERAGRVDEAITTYRAALEVYPDYLPTVEALARLQVRSGRTDTATPAMLKDIAMRGENDAWRRWAVLQGAHLTDRAGGGH
jgi:Flp pilus assembly protein TadD